MEQVALLVALPVTLLWGAIFAYAGVAAGSNSYQIKQEANVSHLWETRERLTAAVGFAVLAFLIDAFHGQWLLLVVCILLGLGMEACQFGLRFDIRLNARRDLDPYYVGTDPQTAATDKAVLGRGLTGKQWALLKLAGVLLCGLVLVALRWWAYAAA